MLQGKIVLITGANRGLGRMLSLRLAKEAAVILLACRNPELAAQLKKHIEEQGAKATVLRLDLTKREDAAEVAKIIEEQYGRLDILVNNAGVFSHSDDGKFEEITEDILQVMVQTNQIGLVRITQYLLPLLRRSQAGRILNLTSDLTDCNTMDGLFTVYRMTKVAVNALTVNLGAELQDTAIRVYGIDPGWMKTEMGGPDAPQTPEEVAEWIEWVLKLNRDVPSGTIFYGRDRAEWWKMKNQEEVDQKLICEQIATFYDLTPKRFVQALGRWGSSYRWVLETDDERLIFLKERPYYQSHAEAPFHRALHHHVFTQGGPVTKLHLTQDESYSFNNAAGRDFEVQDWHNGTHLSPNDWTDLYDLGKVIAQFGEAAKRFDVNRGNWSFPESRNVYHAERLNMIKRFSVPFLRKGYAGLGLDGEKWIEKIVDRLERADSTVEWEKLPQQFLHGDAHVNNCVRLPDGRVLIVDLDDARWGYRLTDLAWACSISSGIMWDTEHSQPRIANELNVEKIKKIVRGYEEIAPLQDAELAALPYLLSMNLVLAFINCTGLDEEDVPPAKDLQDQIETLIHHVDLCQNQIFDLERSSTRGN
ncbi:hypothetical protein CBW65_04360 [Tumebacillus avium]|uniref:Aminoglycoside phosphotransferase domain-containing protein n=1 Tax=Tumebacillus avium TaxID=1903704 RepID=A0A1Y0IM01_9BACL|nr:SDR family NAD(P)-dependent oxidoreductase [Tumebacillus avium]ARU60383.1 hypothetical protein CBW65_04360 [Tumebacillus avium]